MNESWVKETLKAVQKEGVQWIEIQGNQGRYEVLHATYVRGFSEGVQPLRKLRKLQVGLVQWGDYILICAKKSKEESGRNTKM